MIFWQSYTEKHRIIFPKSIHTILALEIEDGKTTEEVVCSPVYYGYLSEALLLSKFID